VTGDIDKTALYAEFGFGGDPTPYDEALAAEGLSSRSKRRISLEKRDRVGEALASRFLPVCHRGDCRAKAPGVAGDLVIVEASSPEHCAICSGSASAAAVEEMVQACGRAGVRRLCIVGGSPEYRQQLRALVRDRLELRLIPGNVARTIKQASADTRWADITVIWGGTILDHKVSNLYTSPDAITVHRRSIQEVARAVAQAARPRGTVRG
jgi:hypothetical protein